MRVFVFIVMMCVALAGFLGGYRLIFGKDLVRLSDFGIGGASVAAEVTVPPTPMASATPVPTAVPTALALPTPTPVPKNPETLVVANTEGLGVYLRRTPKLDDRVRAWPEKSRMEVIGPLVEGDGMEWFKVRAPDGTEGFIPRKYLVPAP